MTLPLRARLAVFSALVCGLLLSVLSVVSYTRWRANEIAIRMGRPLPFSWVLPALAGACLLTSAVLVVLLVIG